MRYSQFIFLFVFALIGSITSAPLADPSGSCSIGDIRLESSMNFIRLEGETGKCYDRRSGETKHFTLTASGSESLQIYVSTVQDGRYFEADGIVKVNQAPGESDNYRITFKPQGAGTFTTAIPVVYGYSMFALSDYKSCIDQKLGKIVEGYKQAIARLESQQIDYSAVTARIQLLEQKHTEQLKPRMKAIEEAETETVALINEKAKVIDELKKGWFCSVCGNSKTEIESHGETFEGHLRDVNGKRVPAPPEKIAEKEREYDQKISNAQSKVNRLRADYARETDRLRQSRVIQEDRERRVLENAHNRVLEQTRQKLRNAESRYEQGLRAYERKEAERKTLMIRVEGVCENE